MPHSDVPTLQQCSDFMPMLSSRRQTAWRTRAYDGAAAARAIEAEAEEESEESVESGDDDSEAGADAAHAAPPGCPHAGRRRGWGAAVE